MPTLSILMPVFNAGEYLDESIESILNQTFGDFELICVDDGSTDASASVLETAAGKDPRIRVLPPYGGNKGVITARNALLAAVTGEYMTWMDADDISAPNRLEKQLDFLKTNQEFIGVGTGITITNDSLIPQRTQTFDPSPTRQAVDPEICCATIMVRSSAAKAAGPMKDAFRPGGEDGDWVLRLAEQGAITNIEDVLYVYRHHGESTSQYFAPIRRLGVVARMAARVRRTTGRDPIDQYNFDPEHNYLSDSNLLADVNLNSHEKTLALSLPLKNRRAFLSILVYFKDCHFELFETMQKIRRQEFQNFEILILDDCSDVPLDPYGLHLESLGIGSRVIRAEATLGFDDGLKLLGDQASGCMLLSQKAIDFMREDRLNHQVSWMIEHPELDATGTCSNQIDRQSSVTRSDFFPTAPVFVEEFKGEIGSIAIWKESPFSKIRKNSFSLSKRTASLLVENGVFEVKNSNAVSDGGDNQEMEAIVDADRGLLALLPSNAVVANLPHILYYRRVVPINPKDGDSLSDHIKSTIDGIPYHNLYYRMRAELGRQGLSVNGDHRPDDVDGLRTTIWQLEVLMRPICDRDQLGDAIAQVTYLEWRRKGRSLLNLLGAWSRVPKSASRLLRQSTKRKVGELYETIREGIAPIIPRGGILGARSPLTRLFGKKFIPAEPTKLRVAIYDSWGDLPDALDHLLPHRRRSWKGVEFIPVDELAQKDNDVDYALILNHVGNRPLKIELPPNRIWFAMGEPPTIVHRELQLGQGSQSFIMTTDPTLPQLSVEGGRRYEHVPCMTRTWSVKRTVDELVETPIPKKLRTLSWVTSNLTLLAGHRYRMAFLEKIKQDVPISLFGRGFFPLVDKWDGLAPFKYSIAFENTISEGYITEKIFDCWVAGALPLYYGAPDVEKYFPADALYRFDPEDKFVAEKLNEVIHSDMWLDRAGAMEEARQIVLHKHNMFKNLAERMLLDDSDPAPTEEQWFYPTDLHFR